MEEKEIRNIAFIKPDDKLSILPYSFSGATTIKVEKGKEKYFLKIIKYFENCYEKVVETDEIFRKYNIPKAQLLEHGKINNDKYYYVYTFINGINLFDYVGSENKFFENGRIIGKYLKMIKRCDINKLKYINTKNNTETMEATIKRFFEYYPEIKETVNEYFSFDQLLDLKEKFEFSEKSFAKDEQVLIFGDIKTQNIILQGEVPILVDYENLEINYDAINFRYNIESCFSNNVKQINSRAFYSGIFSEMYGENLPINFTQNLIYIFILNFFSEVCDAFEERNKKSMIKILDNHARAYIETKAYTQIEGIF